ncbi:MAG: AAA family ATPase [Anaerolineae bacterium]|nr:AAA family ATPase [Anaerolineae bacterium]MBL8104490.1 AAA family ATPase [Anaerolineales bacterium]MCC7189181.1 AAA family ATPase [Anaerolineales bacterium]
MDDSTPEFLKRLRKFVQAEADAQYRALEKQWSHPLQERVARGWAIEGLRVEQVKNGIIRLSCITNDSRFREGDLVLLHRDDPHDPDALHCELQYDGETDLEVSLIRGNEVFLASNPESWIMDQDWFDASPFYLEALNAVADSQLGRSTILPLLQGSLSPKIDYARYERARSELQNAGLNDSQMEAVALSYATDLLHLIQGPPGTGKTLMLAHLARLLVKDGRRVFVTALTHRAIHNALNKISQVDDSIPVCKIGEGRHASDLNVPNFERFDQSRFGENSGGYVIGATPFALQSRRLSGVEFDVALFDEASQITLPLAIMGMLAGSKYVFIGDEKQLPPVTVFSATEATQASIFGYLAGRGNETMLDVTYRLNDTLTEWPSRTFYRNELKSSEEAAGRRLNLSPETTRWDFALDPASPAVFLDLCHQNTTVRSRIEADVVMELILSLFMRDVSPEDIGVVVPYRAQSRLIRSLIRRNLLENDLANRLVVDTVERMQGQEREVIIVSFATASAKFAAQVADFLFQPQRLNVAVTRPRTKLILVGSHHMLDADQYDGTHQETMVMVRNLIDGCHAITVPDGRLD